MDQLATYFTPNQEPDPAVQERRVASLTDAWAIYDQKQQEAAATSRETNNVRYQEEPVKTQSPIQNQETFSNKLPARYRAEEAEPERDLSIGMYNPLAPGYDDQALAADLEESVMEEAGQKPQYPLGYFNPGKARDRLPLFHAEDENAQDLSEAEDPSREVFTAGKPYVVLKDTKTGTRVKMATEPAQAFMGLQGDLAKMGKADKVSLQESHAEGNKALSIARGFVGEAFEPGVREQCANFVRSVFKQAGIEVGASANPVDKHLTGEAQGPGYANSFFGEDVGTLIHDQEDLMPGDIVGFQNTYGAYAPGTITHVGIYAGDGKVIDRPTANGTVKMRDVSAFGGVSIGVRPYGAGKTGGHIAAHSIAVDPNDEDVIRKALDYGFSPSGRKGVLTYMGVEEFGSMDEPVEKPPVPYESDADWNEYMEEAYNAAYDVGVDPSVYMNLVKHESNWNPNAESGVGAFGLSQLMPETAKEQASMMGIDATVDQIKADPKLQALLGAGYYKRMLDKFGNHPQAIAAYNVGPGAMESILASSNTTIPEETVNHVSKVFNVSPERAEALIRDFKGEEFKVQSKKEAAAKGEPVEVGPVAPKDPIRNDVVEEELEYGFYNPQTVEEEEALINGLKNSPDPLPGETQNAGAQRKENATKEVVARVALTPEEHERSAGDWKTIGVSMVDSTLGMAVGVLDNTLGAKMLRDFIWGEEEGNKKVAPVYDALEHIFGMDAQRKSDFEFGRARTGNWLKGVADTLTLGFANYLSPTGTIYTPGEKKAREELKIAARQQGGLWMNDAPAEKGSFFDHYHNLMVDLGENPLSFVAAGVQMQALGAIARGKTLTGLAQKSGATGSLAKGTQNMFNFLGGMEATGVTPGGKLVQTMTNSVLRFEVSQGILGGTEAFNSAFATNLLAAEEGRMTDKEAFTDALQQGAMAATAGLVLGLGTNYIPGIGKLGVQGLRTAAGEFSEKPLVKAAKNWAGETTAGKRIAGATKWVGEKLSQVSEVERIAKARETLSNLGKEGAEMWEKHVGQWVTKFKENLEESVTRHQYGAEAFHSDQLARQAESKGQGLMEHVRDAQEKVQTRTQALEQKTRLAEETAQRAAGPTYAEYTTLKEDFRAKATEKAQIEAQIQQLQGHPQAPEPDVVSRLSKRRDALEKELQEINKRALEKRAEVDAAVQQYAAAQGIELRNHENKPVQFSQFEEYLKKEKLDIEGMEEQKLLKELPSLQVVHEGYMKAARLARERAEHYRKIGSGEVGIPAKPIDPWRPPESELSPDSIEEHVQAMFDRPGNVLPEDQMREIEMMVMSQQGLHKTVGSMERYLKSIDQFMMDPRTDAKLWAPRVGKMKDNIREAIKAGKNGWEVVEAIQNGGGKAILDSMVLKNLATREPAKVQVPLWKMFQESNGTRMALLGKLSQMDKNGKYDILSQKLLDEMRLNVEWEEDTGPVQELMDAINSMIVSGQRGDKTIAEGGTGFFKAEPGEASGAAQQNIGKRAALRKGMEKFKDSRGSGKDFRERVGEAVAEVMASHGKFEVDPFNVVRAGAREIISSKRAYDNLGVLIQQAVDAEDGIYKTAIREWLDTGPLWYRDPTTHSGVLAGVLAEADPGDEAGAIGRYLSDAMFGRDESLKDILQEIPDLQKVLQPIVSLHNTISKLGLITVDAKTMADQIYRKSYFPAMKAYDNLFPDSSEPATKVLKDAGVFGPKGELLIGPKDIDQRVAKAESLLAGTDRLEFVKMSVKEQQAVVGKGKGLRDMDGEFIPATEKEVQEVLAGVLMTGRVQDPGELLYARLNSLGNAETQRKFFDRLTRITHTDGSPIVKFTPGHGYRAASTSKKFTPNKYYIDGQFKKNNEIFIKDEAFDLYEDLMGDMTNEGVERFMRTSNMLALQGLHTPFLTTIGANVWKAFGFNMAKTGKAFTIREDFSPQEFTKIQILAAQHGLEDQSVAKNATILTKAFIEDHGDALREHANTLLQQPDMKKAADYVIKSFAGESGEGVGKKILRGGKAAIDTSIAADEFLMEHILFQQLRDSQYGLWMYKANEIEAKLAPELAGKGYSPEAIRDLAYKQAATFVNTTTGSIEKAMLGKKTRGYVGFLGMTPQFLMARVRAVTGAVTEDAFRHLPAEIRPRLVSEYKWHLGKILGASFASSALMQWALTGSGPSDNSTNNQLKINSGNYYFSNPIANIAQTLTKLTGTQELGRMVSLSLQEGLGMEVPDQRINPMNSDSMLGAAKGAAYGVVDQSTRQAANLTSPLLRAGVQSAFSGATSVLNPDSDMSMSMSDIVASNSGLYQMMTNKNPFTGEPRESWQRWAEVFGGTYVSENNDLRSHDVQVRRIKKDYKNQLRRDVKTLFQAAYGNWEKGNHEEARELYKAATIKANVGKQFKEGGVPMTKEARRLLAQDADYNPFTKTMSLSQKELDNIKKSLTKPQEYRLDKSATNTRGTGTAKEIKRRREQREMDRSASGSNRSSVEAGAAFRSI